MALTFGAGQAVTSGSSTLLGQVPSGVTAVTISNTGSGVAYLGSASTVTTTSGFPLPAGAVVSFTTHPGSTGSPVYAISASTSTVGMLISTAA